MNYKRKTPNQRKIAAFPVTIYFFQQAVEHNKIDLAMTFFFHFYNWVNNQMVG